MQNQPVLVYTSSSTLISLYTHQANFFHCLKHPEGQASGQRVTHQVSQNPLLSFEWASPTQLMPPCLALLKPSAAPGSLVSSLCDTPWSSLGPGSVINFFRPVSFSFPPTAAPTLSYRIKHTHFLKQTLHHTFVHGNLVPQWCLSLIHTSKFLIIIKIRNLLDLMYNWAYQRLW